MMDISLLQELPPTENEMSAQGCCALGSIVTCPWRTFDW